MQLDQNTLKSLRHKLNWTQQQLADACDVSLRTIQRVEKEGAASRETTMALCAVFEVRQGELIKLEEANAVIDNPNPKYLGLIIAVCSLVSFALGVGSVFIFIEL